MVTSDVAKECLAYSVLFVFLLDPSVYVLLVRFVRETLICIVAHERIFLDYHSWLFAFRDLCNFTRPIRLERLRPWNKNLEGVIDHWTGRYRFKNSLAISKP